ncbi:hypothetical protein AD428_10125 [Achromobacter sp. DMS1]|uniref:hypothetical protein n=1 Tax=Achromobacter sp. DMS1 TaxID=1688405 RepID=UPI00069F4FA2|nr:hypothetical protein [Achromobacter sp. DMS1]KOF53939.1 hypothetical protein AD428_10125 [Achromobacter sp. DMS1]
MSDVFMHNATTESVLRDYFHAKDENRPLYMTRAFASDAVLRMALRTQAIAFPPESHGLAAITDTLVRKFGQTYENVHTFYLSRPEPGARLAAYSCDWLVGMTEKATGDARVGCGRYEWEFQPEPYRASSLVITIESMVTLPAGDAGAVFGWLLGLEYPWTTARRAADSAPPLEALAPVVHYLLHPQGL